MSVKIAHTGPVVGMCIQVPEEKLTVYVFYDCCSMEAFLVSKTPWLAQTSRHSSTLLSVCISHRWAALNHSTGLSPEKGEGVRVWTGFISRLFLDPCQIPPQQPFISAYIQESCWAPLYLGVCTAGTAGRSRDL